jgi:hypothetical protein
LKLRKHLHLEDMTPTSKWRRAIKGPRYVPKHKPDQVPQYAEDNERRFFRDFSYVADLLNRWHEHTPWSFENTGRLETGIGSENGTEREVEIRYNQQRTGTIKLSCINYGGATAIDAFESSLLKREALIRAELSLINGRFFDGFEVLGLATSLTNIINDEPDGKLEAQNMMVHSMINAMWQKGEEVIGNPEVEFVVSGRASWYLKEWLPQVVG